MTETTTDHEAHVAAHVDAIKSGAIPNLYAARHLAHDVRLIGLSGYARSGKNAVGQILEDAYGFRQESFAQALKNVAAEINPLLREGGGWTQTLAGLFAEYEDWDAVKENVPAAREFLQRLGVACRDQIGPDVWVDALARRLTTHPAVRYVITDVRFPNEASFITGMGGQVWRIERPGTGPVNGHVSETAVDHLIYDRIIENNGSLQDLRRKILDGTP